MHRLLAAIESWVNRLGAVVVSATKIVVVVLLVILVVPAVGRLVEDWQRGVVRLKPFEVAKSLEESGFNGHMLAERFRKRMTDIEDTVQKGRFRGGRSLATTVIRGGDSLGEFKVPGAGLPLDELEDLALTILRRPPIMVTGRICATPQAMVAAIKVEDRALHPLPPRVTPGGCDEPCVDELVGQMAEAFYAEKAPCLLEAYRYLRNSSRADLEAAARLCRRDDPVFAHYTWGRFAAEQGDLHTALSHLQRALELAPREGRRRRQLEAIIHINWGAVFMQVHDCGGAIEQYELAIAADPKAAWAYLGRGYALAGIAAKGAATMYAMARTAADPDPPPPLASANWSHLLYAKGRYREAAALLQEAAAKAPDDIPILYHLGYALERAGKKNEALDAYERIIGLDPRELDAYKVAADLLRSCHRRRAARELLWRALDVADKGAQPKLRCELAELDRQLRERSEDLALQVRTCDISPGGAEKAGSPFLRQSWIAMEPCYSSVSHLQVIADPWRSGVVYSLAKLPGGSAFANRAKSNDGGATWSAAPVSLIGVTPGAQIRRIALDARHGTLVVLSSNGSIARSSDHGTTWRLAHGPTETDLQPSDLAVDGSGRAALYVLLAGKVPCPANGADAPFCARYRVYTSHDLGDSWGVGGTWMLPAPKGADPKGADPAGRLWIDPFATSTLYAAVSAGPEVGSFRKSVDGGATWKPVAVDPSVTLAAFDPHAPGTLYVVAGACGRLLKSFDAGGSWLPVDSDDLPLCTEVTALGFDGAMLYAGTSDRNVLASSDGARTWHEVARGLPERPILGFATGGGGTVYAGTAGGGLYASSGQH